jgi:hypothetical protein
MTKLLPRYQSGLSGTFRGNQAPDWTGSITDLAEHEGITIAFVCRLLPLTCLAPDIVEAILDGRQPKGLRLAELLRNGPVAWESQRLVWGFSN